MDQPYSRPPNHMAEKPRRVRGGVRLLAKQWPLELSWAGERWMTMLRSRASEGVIAEALEYARAGQSRSMTVEPGRVVALVQGRALKAYRVVLDVRPFSDADWNRALSAIADQAIYAAKILAGEMPEAIDELFTSLGLSLFPAEGEAVVACSAPDERPWCKHACCVGLLIAEALGKDPYLILTLRGMPATELLERLRDLRAVKAPASGPGGSTTPVGKLGVSPSTSPPLEASLDEFWDAGPALADLEIPIRPPEVSHPLLRRLGPSPFADGKFPLVGLLATCYDAISQAAIRDAALFDEPAQDPPDQPADPDEESEA